ncbi:protein WVD2-like 3 [Aristolochia californica]|uniref:protein WVD2-like 3 n=1 Tax=Aristolochia californica TaxID=171875 RepID=UPI0035DC7FA8
MSSINSFRMEVSRSPQPEQENGEELPQEKEDKDVQIPEKIEETTVAPEAESGVVLQQIGLSETERDVSEKQKANPMVEEGPVSEAHGINEKAVDQSQVTQRRKLRVKPKQNDKPKPTVPRPFNFATETRTSREGRRESDKFRELKPILSKSTSLGVRSVRSARSSSGRVGRSPERGGTGRDGSTGCERLGKKGESGHGTEKELRRKEMEVQKSQSTITVAENSEMMKKNPTFKSSPLPNFPHEKKFAPKPELKKTPSTPVKPPLLGHGLRKSLPDPENRGSDTTIPESPKNAVLVTKSKSIRAETTPSLILKNATGTPGLQRTRAETTSPNEIATVPMAGLSDTESSRRKKSSPKTISSSSKETINRFLRASQRTPATKIKDPVKEEIPSNNQGKALLAE